MLPNYLLDHVYSFIDFHTMIKLISVPSLYRYLLRLANFVRIMEGTDPVFGILQTLEPYYHLNRYQGITIYQILKFMSGIRIVGNNITYGVTRELWIHNYEWHRVYGPAVIYRSSHHPNLKYREGWYLNGGKHRDHGPSIIVYFDSGKIKYKAYTRCDSPYRPNDEATMVEYNQYGDIVAELWQHIDGSIKMIKRTI